MIFATDFADARTHSPLTAQDVLLLLTAIRKHKRYMEAPARWPKLEQSIRNQGDGAATAPTDGSKPFDSNVAMGLSIILWKLEDLGSELVAKEGGDAATFFSVRDNRDDLVDEILTILYPVPAPSGPTSFALVQRGAGIVCGPYMFRMGFPVYCGLCCVYMPCRCGVIYA